MTSITFAVLFLFNLAWQSFSSAQVTYPLPGEVLSGRVIILGSADAADFLAYELAFTYPGHPQEAYFLIHRAEQPVRGGILGSWDTTLIVDGDYELLLTVFRKDAAPVQVIVSNLRVRNQNAGVVPTWMAATFSPTPTPASTLPPPQPTFTPLPANPAALSTAQLGLHITYGALFGLILTLVLVWLLRPRKP